MGAGAAIAAVAAGTAISAGTSMMAAGKQADAAKQAANAQQAMYQQTRGDLQPYFQPGVNALTQAYNVASRGPTGGGPDYISMAQQNLPGNMTQAMLEATPGYEFTLKQGLKATQSANAARGLGVSGAALRGAATYATGLADSTYTNRFNESQKRFEDFVNLNQGQQGNLKAEFDRYNTLATLGANAAAGLGTQGQLAARAEGTFLNAAGQAQAEGIRGVGNALNSGINNYLAYDAYNSRTAAQNPMTGGYVDSGSFA